MSEAELQLHRARRIGERWGWLTTFLYKNESGMYSVKKKKKKKMVYKKTKKQKNKKMVYKKNNEKKKKWLCIYIYMEKRGRNRYMVRCKGNCSTVE